MSGHSKWSKVKHQKAVTDVAKAAAFTRTSRAITIAVSQGGGITDPNSNFKLRLAIEKAREVNMPKENIERAIEKAKGGGEHISEESYEGYGPHGVAFFIEAATDNNKRTISFIKQILEHAGGSMASPGAVSYLFERKGVLVLPHDSSYDQVMEQALDAGADDVITKEDCYEVYTQPTKLFIVKKAFEEKGIAIDTANLIMEPKVPVSLTQGQHEEIERVLSHLEELDDVQKVFTNAEEG